jgi:hypothetical protein
MLKMDFSQTSHFCIPPVFAIMTKMKRPFINPPQNAPAPARRFFNQ